MSGWQSPRLLILCVALLGVCSLFRPAAALPGLPIIIWDPIRQVWVDAKTRGVVTVSSNTVTQPTAVAAAPSYTQQGRTRPQRASAKEFFPLVIPDMDWWKTCDRNSSDLLTTMTTKCDIFKDLVNCQQLASMGYLPSGIQSFVPHSMHGGFTIPNGCSTGNLGIEYDGLKMVFNSPQVPIMAVIAKDVISKVFYFGSGVTQGKLLKLLAKKVEFCYAPPSISPLYVSKTAAYSTGMQPGSASWNFFKTAQLAAPFTNNIASLFRGDTADVTWALQVQKTGTDTVYQGAVTGQITITNPQATPVTVYGINSYVQGGPSSTVSCGTQMPFQIPPCSSSVCNYVGYWPLAPAAGQYTNLADVSYTVGDSGAVGNQVGTAAFQVGTISPAVGVLNTPNGLQIPAGQALVQDAMAPQQYFFSSSAQQTYTTQLACPDTAIVTNQATMTAATGQTITQTATVQKLCYDLQVRVAQAASPFVGKWSWDVTKEASMQSILLKPSATAWDKYVKQQMDLAIASGQDPQAAMELITGGVNATALSATTMDGSMTGEITYKVTFTRTPPGGFVAGAPAFQAVGDVFITNASPLNAQLKEVTVAISNPFGGTPYRVAATCPILTVAAGQTLQCRYVATPAFNPIGAQVVAIAHYLNQRNGIPTGATTPFTSAAVTMAGGVSPREPQPMPQSAPAQQAMAQQPATPVPQMVVPTVSRRRLLSPGVNEALSNIVRQVSVTTTSGRGDSTQQGSHPYRNSGSSTVGISSGGSSRRASGNGMGQKVMKDILKGIVAAFDEAPSSHATHEEEDTVETHFNITGAPHLSVGGGNMSIPLLMPHLPHPHMPALLVNLLKNITIDSDQNGNTTQDALELLVHLLPKLPSLGINLEGGDWADILTIMRDMLPDDGFMGLIKNLGQMPNITLPKMPKLPSMPDMKLPNIKLPSLPSLPKGPTITINSTGPIEDDYQEKTMEGVSKVLTRITNIIERNNKSTITVTAKAMTPEKMLERALEALAKHQDPHSDEASEDDADQQDQQENGTMMAEQGQDTSVSSQAEMLALEQAPAAAPFQLQGLSDECVDVRDAFAAGNGYTTGMVVSGALPGGRICDTTTFTYTVRYGPYSECFDRKAVNKASFTTVDTNTTGEASSTVNVQVAGCGPAVTASIKSYAVWGKKGYTWTVQKTANPSKLEVNQNTQGSVDYTVAYTRNEVLNNPKLSATVQFDNLNLNGPANVNTFSFKVTSNCPDGVQHKTGTFSCPGSTIPAGGTPLSCKFKVDLPCSAPGVLLANAVAEDKAVRSNAFNFPAPEPTELPDERESDDQLSTGECVMVTDEFKQGQWLVTGNVSDVGAMPYGKLCGSKVFTYRATFGPFKNCGKKKAINTASLSAGTPDSVMQSQVALPISVVGCAVYTPAKTYPVYSVNTTTNTTNTTVVAGAAAPVGGDQKVIKKEINIMLSHSRLQQQQGDQPQQQQQLPAGGPMGANCVSPLHFWKNCIHREPEQQNGRCAVVNKLPAGPMTPFFPQPGVKNNRHYKGVMGKPTNTGNRPTDMWFKAAQTLVATQLNELSGVVLPPTVMDAVSLVGSVVGTTSATPPTINMQLPGLANAINLLEMFNSGQAGVEPC